MDEQRGKPATSLHGVRLSTDRFVLDPVIPRRDSAEIHAILTAPENAFRYRGFHPDGSLEAVDALLASSGVLVQYSVRTTSDRACVGLIQCMAPNYRHGTAQFGVVLRPDVQGRGWPMIAVVLAIANVFGSYPVRKLYFEVPDFNFVTMERGYRRLLTYEGKLRDHEWHAGEYWDVHFLSIDREGFLALPVVKRILRSYEGAAIGPRKP